MYICYVCKEFGDAQTKLVVISNPSCPQSDTWLSKEGGFDEIRLDYLSSSLVLAANHHRATE